MFVLLIVLPRWQTHNCLKIVTGNLWNQDLCSTQLQAVVEYQTRSWSPAVRVSQLSLLRNVNASEWQEVGQNQPVGGSASLTSFKLGNDGNTATTLSSCAQTTAAANAYWYIDLGRVHLLNRLLFTGRQDIKNNTIINAVVRIGVSSSVLTNPIYFTFASGAAATTDIRLPNGVVGRYIAIHQPSGSAGITVCELQVYSPVDHVEVAYSKAATLSSTNSGSSSALAVDGDPSQSSASVCAISTVQTDPWLSVDLGPRCLAAVLVFHARCACVQARTTS